MNFNHKTYCLGKTDRIKTLGRILLDSGLFLSWSNSGVELLCKGNRVDFVFEDLKGSEPVYVKAFSEKGEQRFGLLGASPRVILEFEEDREHLVKKLGLPLEDVSKMASFNPAKGMKLENETGSIGVGKKADLVLLDKELNVVSTYVDGVCAYKKEG